MDVSQGSKLGGYEVVSSLGAGGMGEVYRARDPRLGRDVALKLLPADIANDPERLARFRREAQVLASLTAHGTQAGMILGTAAYMSPEQARGRPVDKRADVWAFGVVLYEMLTGTRLFAGETVSDVLASVLKSEPDWSALGADVPPRVRRVLARCLQKDPRQRLHDIGDARLELLEK